MKNTLPFKVLVESVLFKTVNLILGDMTNADQDAFSFFEVAPPSYIFKSFHCLSY